MVKIETIIKHINKQAQQVISPQNRGVDVFTADWDVLVVLDGCRADTFEHVAPIDSFDNYERKRSRASMTGEWLEQNFSGLYGSIVYVAGNPIVSRDAPNRWHRLIESWRDGFDESFGQVHAGTVTDDAVEAAVTYGDKRLIVHYMQPHAPFVGYPDLHYNSWDGFEDIGATLDGHDTYTNVWEAAAAGEVNHDDVWKGYRDNLRYVLREVNRLLQWLPNGTKVVLTSDHGNVIKVRDWPIPLTTITGHPRNVRHHDLITVPWAEAIVGRRSVTDDGVTPTDRVDSKTIDDRLEALGYVT